MLNFGLGNFLDKKKWVQYTCNNTTAYRIWQIGLGGIYRLKKGQGLIGGDLDALFVFCPFGISARPAFRKKRSFVNREGTRFFVGKQKVRIAVERFVFWLPLF